MRAALVQIVLAFLLWSSKVRCKIGFQASLQFGFNGFSITDFISQHGYPVEAHVNIETEDGYLLDMFRIPYGRFNKTMEDRPVAFLMHGLLGSAENWIIGGPDKGLAFLLADLGYDVWMGNARGSMHSRKHVNLNPDSDSSYWQFSWHEIGVYDLPTKIDYIIEETNQTELYYIGHSQGTTVFFVMASELPSYNGYIKLMIALAPSVYTANLPHPALQVLSIFSRPLDFFLNLMGITEFVPNNEILQLAGQAVCQRKAVVQEICTNILFLIAGYDSDQIDSSVLPLAAKTTPAGASTRQLVHYGQGIRSGEFRQYDFGMLQNLATYGSVDPPMYDLSLVSAPVALFVAQNDWLVSIKDVKRLAAELPNVVLKYLVPHKSFNHLDFIIAKDVVKLVYSKVFEIMESFSDY